MYQLSSTHETSIIVSRVRLIMLTAVVQTGNVLHVCGMWQSFNRPDYSVSEATERRGPCGRVLGNVLGAVAPVTLGLVPLVPPTLHSCTFQLPPSYIYIPISYGDLLPVTLVTNPLVA